jgi:outer membrane protein
MKKIIILFLWMFTMATSASSQNPDIDHSEIPTEWTLEKAVQFALKSNPDSEITRQRLRAAEADIKAAQSDNYPRLSLQAGYQQTNNPMMAFGSILNQGTFDFGLDFNSPGQIDNFNLRGTISYNLYNGGKTHSNIKAAQFGKKAAKHDQTSLHQQLAFQVIKAYFNILKSQEAVKAKQAAVNAFEENLKVAHLKYEAGTFLKTEVLNLEVELAQTQENLLSMQHISDLTKHSFLNLLGLETNQSLSLSLHKTKLREPSQPVASEISHRPEIAAMEARVSAAKAALRSAKGGRFPTVNAFGSYQYDEGWRRPGSGDNWAAGISVDLNLFDGQRTKSQVYKAQTNLVIAQEELRKLRLNIVMDIEQAKLTYERAKQRIQVTAKSNEQAEESAQLSRARFEEGVILSSDLINVETRLTEAKMRRAIALADEQVALADLNRALGYSPFPSIDIP